MSTLVSVVVPMFNEQGNAHPLAAKIDDVFAGLPEYDYECLFVNDGSTDGTRDELEALGRTCPHVCPIHLAGNQGQSAALIAGLRRARGDYVITMDGDLQNDPADVPAFLEALANVDCVCGCRVNRRDGWGRRLASRVANRVFRRLFGVQLNDAGCGLKAFRRPCLAHIVPFNGVHRFLPIMMRNGGMTWAELPIRHHARVRGTSKYGIRNRLWRVLYDIIGVAWLQRRYVVCPAREQDSAQ
ncbi:MAG: glycosyltransferase family 2 protein [Candidatus Hydrogenedentes bacterium]|nr:glycosyltransferase family 2 protein [Candidatus Hydrogenedentota bacterium]